jgi:hypothetical protein
MLVTMSYVKHMYVHLFILLCIYEYSYIIYSISGNLNLLEPQGTVQACNGIALPLADPRGSAV